MSKKKNKYTSCICVCVAIKGKEKRYLSNKDIENGLDIQLDLMGYEIKIINTSPAALDFGN